MLVRQYSWQGDMTRMTNKRMSRSDGDVQTGRKEPSAACASPAACTDWARSISLPRSDATRRGEARRKSRLVMLLAHPACYPTLLIATIDVTHPPAAAYTPLLALHRSRTAAQTPSPRDVHQLTRVPLIHSHPHIPPCLAKRPNLQQQPTAVPRVPLA
jgi:hypothetical protein